MKSSLFSLNNKKRNLFFLWGIGVFLGLLGLLALAFCVGSLWPESLPSFNQVKKQFASSDWVLLDRQGKILHEFRGNYQQRKLHWVPLEQISPALVPSILQSEDKRFYDHPGVDFLSLGKNLIQFLLSRPYAGASTLTMQLVSLLHPSTSPSFSPSPRRSLRQKCLQIFYALQLDWHWSKEEILEAYLNLVSFRGELQGIHAASWGLFKKHPLGLHHKEALLLAVLIRSPNASSSRIFSRILTLDSASARGHSQLKKWVEQTLTPPHSIPRWHQKAHSAGLHALKLWQNSSSPQPQFPSIAPFPQTLTTTLDFNLQSRVESWLKEHLRPLRSQNVHDGAVLVVDNQTGHVLAYVGNAGEQSSSPHVDGVLARRLSGSTLKPFLYALGIDQKIFTSASLLLDSPLNISLPTGIFSPQNYDHHYRGLVTVRESLASSLNIPAVRALELVGLPQFVKTLSQLQISKLREPDFYGPSLALGSLEVSLWELVNAYRTFHNDGVWSPIHLLSPSPAASTSVSTLSGPSPSQIFSPQTAYIIKHILSDRQARSLTFSLESPLSTAFWTAVKTGTSKDMRDNWCIGLSSHYTVGVWVGNFSGAPMWNVSGLSGAAPLWQLIMNYLHQNKSAPPPPAPPGILTKTMTLRPQGRTYQEVFLSGTLPVSSQIHNKPHPHSPRIIYPSAGLVVALDPEIPLANQKIPLESTPLPSSLTSLNSTTQEIFAWKINGKLLPIPPNRSRHSRNLYWHPSPGRHILTLISKRKVKTKNQSHDQGFILDEIIHDQVSFLVR